VSALKETADLEDGAAGIFREQANLSEEEISYVDISREWRDELLDPEGWNKVLETFAVTMRLAVALTDREGRLLGKCHNPQPAWLWARAAKPQADVGCPFCLAPPASCSAVADALGTGKVVMVEDHAGLAHVAVPLSLGGQQLGSLIAGQVFNHFPEPLPLQRVARELGISPQEFWQKAVQQVPVSRATLQLYADLLMSLDQAFLGQRYAAILERKLTQTSRRYRLFFDGVKDYALFTADRASRITSWNSGAERLFGYTAAEIMGQDASCLVVEDDVHRERQQRMSEADRLGWVEYEGWRVRKDGTRFLAAGVLASIGEGDAREFGSLVRDVTDLRRSEQGLRELDRLKTDFFANISHELRTPLTLILGPVRKRLAAGGVKDEERQDMELIQRNARLLLRHVNDLLDLSKLDAGGMNTEYAEVDLARMVRRAASNFEGLTRERGVTCAIEAPASLPAELDPPKIERVLLNLLSNAFKFTPPGGNVRIAVRGLGDRAIVEVEDSGPGIPPEMREAIFDRFHQLEGGADRRFGGTGLGLSIARQFVNLHGGSIGAEEPRNRSGSLFRVELPLKAPGGADVRRIPEQPDMEATRQAVEELRVREPARRPSGPATASGAPVVLLVEDNPDMNAFIAETLSATYRVFCAFDGQEGLEKAQEVHPDLILCDIMMPRMSGERMVREIRRHPELEDVPIVLLTAKVDDDLRVELLREGAQDYLCKPLDTRTILAKVGRFIADRRRRKETEEALHRLSGSLLQVHDRERKEIAQELHENTVQCLAAVQIQLSMARTPAASPEVTRILADGHALLEQCSCDLRTLSYGLHPPLLDNLGLKAAMESHIQNFIRANGIQVSLDIPSGLGRLPADIELTLFRVMQESLMNLGCHSAIGKAGVRVFGDAFEAGLEVTAKGWPAGEPAAEIGIAAIRERVRSLGGQLEIASGVEGTTVRAVLPFPAGLDRQKRDRPKEIEALLAG